MGELVSDEEYAALGLSPPEFGEPQKKEEPGFFARLFGGGEESGLPTADDYRSSLDSLVSDDSFYDLPYEEQLNSIRSIYLGEDQSGSIDWDDEDEVLGLHKQAVSLINQANERMVHRADYEDLLPPKPDISQANTPIEAIAMLDAWEATALRTARAEGGIYWTEIEDVAEQQIADEVDREKKLLVSRGFFGEQEPGAESKGEQVLEGTIGGVSTVIKGAGTTLASLIPGDTGTAIERLIETSPLLPEREDIIDNKVAIHTPLGSISSAGVFRGIGSGVTFIGTGGAVGAVTGSARIAAAAMVPMGSRLAYKENYDSVYESTQDPERAALAGWANVPIGALEGVFDASVATGLISSLTKNIGRKTMEKVLAKLSANGWLGDGFRTGFAATRGGATTGVAEGVQEVLQGEASGEISAAIANDPSLRQTRDDRITSLVAGFASGAPFGAAQGATQDTGARRVPLTDDGTQFAEDVTPLAEAPEQEAQPVEDVSRETILPSEETTELPEGTIQPLDETTELAGETITSREEAAEIAREVTFPTEQVTEATEGPVVNRLTQQQGIPVLEDAAFPSETGVISPVTSPDIESELVGSEAPEGVESVSTEAPTTTKKVNLGISAAAASQFGKSEVMTKLEQAHIAAVEAGRPEDSPVSQELFEEMQSQNAGEYLRTSMPEQELFADQILKDRDTEQFARELLDPNTPNPLADVPTVTGSVVRAKIQADLNQREREARASNNFEKADELKMLSAEFSIEGYMGGMGGRTGIAQALQIGVLNNRILGMSPSDRLLALADDLVKTREKPSIELVREMTGLAVEADRLSREENQIQDKASEINGLTDQVEIFRQNVEDFRTRVQQQKQELQNKRQEFRDEVNKLKRLQKRLEKAPGKIKAKEQKLEAQHQAKVQQLQQEIAELEQRIPSVEESLQKAQARHQEIVKRLKSDIQSYAKFEKGLKRQKRALAKREKQLRQKRAIKREGFTLKSLPESAQGEIKKLAEKYEAAAPGSFLRQELGARIINTAIKHSGGMSPLELADVVWYTNALDGFSTQGINFWGSSLSLGFRSLSLAAQNPKLFPDYVRALITGTKRGGVEARSILTSGRSGSARGAQKFGLGMEALEFLTPTSTLEAIFTLNADERFGDYVKRVVQTPLKAEHPLIEVLTGFGVGKFALRGLRASDAFWYRTSFDAMVGAEMARQAKQIEKLSDEEAATRIANALFLSSEMGKNALTQAEKEVSAALGDETTQDDITRRAFEIMDQQLPERTLQEAVRWGSETTFTQPPQGVFGSIATVANYAVSTMTIRTSWGDFRVLRPVIPFVNIVANVAELGLEFSPVGFVKAGTPSTLTEDQRTEIRYKAIVGSTLAAGLWGLANHFSEEDDPPFAIYGSLAPLKRPRKSALLSAKIKPFTIKIGKHFIPYQETPMFWLAAMGAYFDRKRWDKDFNEQTGMRAFQTLVMGGIGQAFMEQSVLTGIADIFDWFDPSSGKNIIDSAARYFSVFNPGGSFAKDLDRIFGDSYQEVLTKPGNEMGSRFLGGFFKNYPVIGDAVNKPMLDGFGEEIRPGFDERFGLIRRSIGTYRADDIGKEWTFLAERGLNFAGYNNTVKIGKGKKSEQAGRTRLKERRAETIGRAYVNIFTPEERYELVKLAGPQIKEAIGRIADRSEGRTREELQQEIDDTVSDIKRAAKEQMIRQMDF